MADTTRTLPSGVLPSDEWLIQMVLEGRVDADIGGELGLSAGEVRERIAVLASKLDVNGRDGIRRYFGATHVDAAVGAGSERAPYPLTGVIVAVLVLVLMGTVSAVALSKVSSSSQHAANPTAEARTAVAAAVSATAAARIAAENPGGWYDAGPLFFVDGTSQPVVNSSVRALFTAVTLAGPGIIKLDAGNVQWSGSGNVGGGQQAMLTGIIENDVWESVNIRADENTRLLVDSQDSVRFFAVNGAPNPVVLVSAAPLGSGPPHQSTVGNDGRLFFDPAPVPDTAVINSDTGEALDVSLATALDVVLRVDGGSTSCGGGLSDDDGGRCSVYWIGVNPLLMPADGMLSCASNGKLKLATPAFVLYFAAYGGLGAPVSIHAMVPCDSSRLPAAVSTGVGQIGPTATSYTITATTNDPALPSDNQDRLSVAIGGTTVYVGPIHLRVGCPCVGGP